MKHHPPRSPALPLFDGAEFRLQAEWQPGAGSILGDPAGLFIQLIRRVIREAASAVRLGRAGLVGLDHAISLAEKLYFGLFVFHCRHLLSIWFSSFASETLTVRTPGSQWITYPPDPANSQA